MTEPSTQSGSRWFTVPKVLATRHRARELREQAVAEGCRVLDFSDCEWLGATAADELVCNGEWDATRGESPDVREVVERALRRRGRFG